jgi:hypothetical protein
LLAKHCRLLYFIYLYQGVPPATLAEFTLSSDPTVPDNYDVSLVDGYNLPMSLTNNKGCPVGLCGVDLGPNCAFL